VHLLAITNSCAGGIGIAVAAASALHVRYVPLVFEEGAKGDPEPSSSLPAITARIIELNAAARFRIANYGGLRARVQLTVGWRHATAGDIKRV
jgi:hypothetical protein